MGEINHQHAFHVFNVVGFDLHAMKENILVEILTKQNCYLCDLAKQVLDRVLPDYPASLRVTDIETDPKLLQRYKEKIPVVMINGQESFVYNVHETMLRKKLDRILDRKESI